MKRILILIDSLSCGGAEKSLISLLPFIADKYNITLMLRARGGIFEQYVPTKVNIIDFPYTPSLLQQLRYSFALRLPWNKGIHGAELYWKYIGRYYRPLETEYDVAIAYQQGFPTYYIAEKVKAKKKICWINVDLAAAGYSPSFNSPFYSVFNALIPVSKILSEQFVSQGFANHVQQIKTIFDIQNVQLIQQMSKAEIMGENSMCKSSGRYIITTVGRLVKQKGYDLAIEAAETLKANGLDFTWYFVGEGSLQTKLQENVLKRGLSKNIVFTGVQGNPYPFMKNADIYVQTSKFEGFGLTVGEAKILQKPIVSTDFPVIHNQIENEVNGLIVGMSGKEIADGVLRLLNNKDLQNKFVSNLQKENNTTSETESAKVISLIEEK